MVGRIYIDDDLIGSVDFMIVDEGMGVIGGNLTPTSAYEKYRGQIQTLTEKNNIANVGDFNLKVTIGDKQVEASGGIGITELAGFDEIGIDASGVTQSVLNDVRTLNK